MIVESVLRWLAYGAEVLVWDDMSTDGTLEKLMALRARYPKMGVFADETEPYQMQEHINYLKGWPTLPAWIVPADADEIWHFPNNDPAAFFASLPQMPSWGEVPYFDNAPNGNRRQHTHKKCFGYLTDDMKISIGNHLILDGHKWPKIEGHGIYIEHYPIRSYEQMKRKLINHMEAYKTQHPGHPHGENWHKWQIEGEAFFQRKWQEFNF